MTEFTEKLLGNFGTVVAIIVGVYAIIASRRSHKRDSTEDLGTALLVDKAFRAALSAMIRTSVTDHLQIVMNEKHFMPRELQDAKNEDIERRLESLERKIDNVPRDTAEQVMLRLRPPSQR